MADFPIPTRLAETCGRSTLGRAWLDGLSSDVEWLREEWRLTIGAPIDTEVSGSWVAPCERDAVAVILKIGFPHMEALHEIDGLAFWDGEATARLLDADRERNAMLLERCLPGTPLRQRPEAEQDEVIAGLLRRLWRAPGEVQPFRPLRQMIQYWCEASRAKRHCWPDAGLAEEGLAVFEGLCRDDSTAVLLATDLHVGNVLAAEREPWLAIDPKPFVGDPAYDATQHLLNCKERLRTEPRRTISHFAALLEVDEERVRQWTFARLAAESYGDMHEGQLLARSVLT